MPKYLIERDVPGAGDLSDRDLKAMSINSTKVLDELGPDIQWQESFVTDDKIHCVYIARDEDIIREHAKRGEIPITNIFKLSTMIDPTTAENKG